MHAPCGQCAQAQQLIRHGVCQVARDVVYPAAQAVHAWPCCCLARCMWGSMGCCDLGACWPSTGMPSRRRPPYDSAELVVLSWWVLLP